MKLKKLPTIPARSDCHDGNLLSGLDTGWCGNRNAIYFDPNRRVEHLWKEPGNSISTRQQEAAVNTILQKYPPHSTEPIAPIGWIRTTAEMDAVVLQSANGIVRLIQADYWHDAHSVGFDRITINPDLLQYIEHRKDTKEAGCIVFWLDDAPVAVVMPLAVYSTKEAKKLRAITSLTDKVMETPALTIERRAILTVALSRHIMYLQASITDLQGYDTPSAVEAIKDMETELKETETWLQEVKEAK